VALLLSSDKSIKPSLLGLSNGTNQLLFDNRRESFQDVFLNQKETREKVKHKKFTLEHAMKAQKGNRNISLLFL
jgi:hypothetical protein